MFYLFRMQKIFFSANFYVGLHFQKISTSLVVRRSHYFFISFYASQNFGSKFTLEKFLGHVLIFLVPAHYQRPIFPSRYRTTWKIVARRKNIWKEKNSVIRLLLPCFPIYVDKNAPIATCQDMQESKVILCTFVLHLQKFW